MNPSTDDDPFQVVCTLLSLSRGNSSKAATNKQIPFPNLESLTLQEIKEIIAATFGKPIGSPISSLTYSDISNKRPCVNEDLPAQLDVDDDNDGSTDENEESAPVIETMDPVEKTLEQLYERYRAPGGLKALIWKDLAGLSIEKQLEATLDNPPCTRNFKKPIGRSQSSSASELSSPAVHVHIDNGGLAPILALLVNRSPTLTSSRLQLQSLAQRIQTYQSIDELLTEVGLKCNASHVFEEYQETFEQNGTTLESLKYMTVADLEGLAVKKGHAFSILGAEKERRQ
ncbi:hypothetical protein HDU99_005336 [Rhizoclosmatium hyalinum]|nr:hypothetical protein HDU99_005336 [Rhizoclosmatium hyalinum]